MQGKISAVRKVEFCAGHRVMKHESKCAHLHGHNYTGYFHAEMTKGSLDNIGRVMDFSVLKAKIKGWIDKYFDHGTIVHKDDTEVIRALIALGHKHYLMPYNPTAENIGRYLLTKICPELFKDDNVQITRIVIWETSNCYAEVSLEN